MPFPLLVPAIMAGLGALSGGLGNRKETQTSTQNSTTNSTGSQTPNYDPKAQTIRDFLLNQMMSTVEETPDFASGYLNSGISNINRNADASSNAIRQMMISRGLGRTSAGIAPEVANENARFGALSQFQNEAPLKLDEIRANRVGELSRFFATLPYSTNTTSQSTQTGTGTQTNPGNPWAGALQNGSSMAAFLYGQGAFDKKANTGIGGY